MRCPGSRSADEVVESRWSRWQPLVAGGASVVTAPLLFGFAGYVLGGPIALGASVLAGDATEPPVERESRTKPTPRDAIFSIQPSISPQLTPRRELHGLWLGVEGTF